MTLDEELAEFERQRIREALAAEHGNITRAAEGLGISKHRIDRVAEHQVFAARCRREAGQPAIGRPAALPPLRGSGGRARTSRK